MGGELFMCFFHICVCIYICMHIFKMTNDTYSNTHTCVYIQTYIFLNAYYTHTLIYTYTMYILFTNPSVRAGYDTRSIFKRSLTGLNSEFSFS